MGLCAKGLSVLPTGIPSSIGAAYGAVNVCLPTDGIVNEDAGTL
jgi:hypothetical protein